jgi:hypothetical protein
MWNILPSGDFKNTFKTKTTYILRKKIQFSNNCSPNKMHETIEFNTIHVYNGCFHRKIYFYIQYLFVYNNMQTLLCEAAAEEHIKWIVLSALYLMGVTRDQIESMAVNFCENNSNNLCINLVATLQLLKKF